MILGLCLALGACAGKQSSCAGWEKLTPSGTTQAYIVNSDPAFAGQVLGHNRGGAKRGCWS